MKSDKSTLIGLGQFTIKTCLRSMLFIVLISLNGCAQFFDKQIEYETVAPEKFPVLTAVGYAPISTQPGNSEEEKMIMAMQASKLRAYRELAEQVYGQNIDGTQTIAAAAVQNSQVEARVSGVVQGARVVKAYSIGDDTYVTEMHLDMRTVHELYLSISRPQRIKNVTYY